jgi:glyoxylate/hydroxypyruvate reductase A
VAALLLAISGYRPEPWAGALSILRGACDVRVWPDAGDPADIRYALAWKPPHGLLAGFPKLEAIFSLGAGVDALMRDPTLPAVPVVRYVDPDLTGRMREYVALHVLAHHRRMLDYAAQQHSRLWRELPQPAAREVRVGVMGLGVLGQDACVALAMLGFQVAGWSRTPKKVAGVACFAGAEQLAPFLARTDILVCLLPLTPETEGILNMRLFRLLARDGALPAPVVINAGRGGLQNEADILAALKGGVIGAASLDVFAEEPLPDTSPLWGHPRVILTPHNAAWSSPEACARAVVRQIKAHQNGAPLAHVVDRSLSY